MQVTINSTLGMQYDLCVVGSGPAGIILALEYNKLRPEAQVLILEYGDGKFGANRLDDSIVVSNPTNHYPPYEATNKGLGGTSKTWGGRCVLYDEIDFLDREIIGNTCTWNPDLFADIKKYTSTAGIYFDCGEPVFSLHDIPALKNRRIAAGFVEGDVLDSVLERWSLPTRFGARYREPLLTNSKIHIVMGCEVTKVCIEPENVGMNYLETREVDTATITRVHAKQIVLAAGAQEVTRLLLRSPEIFQGLGGIPSALGKFYQGHISGKIASVKFHGNPRETDYGFTKDNEGIYLRRRFQFPTKILQERNLLNTAFWLDNPLYYDPSHKNGSLSLIYLMMLMPFIGKRLLPPALAHSITKGKATRVGEHLFNVVRNLPKSLIEPFMVFLDRYFRWRKLPGVFFYNANNVYALHFHAEQVPRPENCMELAGDKETLTLNYSYSDTDVDSVIRAHDLLDQWLRKCGCGELEYWYSPSELPEAIRNNSKDGIHQVGTTRIGQDASEGVVDSNLRIWGTQNLYICSSSIFPTSGQANPTFMLGAFAVRLAHYLVAL